MPIHPFWIIAIVVVVLIVFGPGRLPELGGAIGKAMREFRKPTSECTSEVTHSTQPVSPRPRRSRARGPSRRHRRRFRRSGPGALPAALVVREPARAPERAGADPAADRRHRLFLWSWRGRGAVCAAPLPPRSHLLCPR